MRVGPGVIPGRNVEGIDFVRLTVGIVEFVAAPEGESTTRPPLAWSTPAGDLCTSQKHFACAPEVQAQSDLVSLAEVCKYCWSAWILQQCLRSAC